MDTLVPKLRDLLRSLDPQPAAQMDKNDCVARFTAQQASHELRIQYSLNSFTLSQTVQLPGAAPRWFLESKWVWFPEKGGCSKVKLAPLDARYKLFASDEAFFRAVFSSPKLPELLMQVDAGEHLKANLKDGILKIRWIVRFNPAFNDRDAILLGRAAALLRIGLECCSGIQAALKPQR